MVLSRLVRASFVLPAILIGGCANVPSEGPTTKEVKVARQLLAQRSLRMFSETLGTSEATSEKLGPGDVVEVSIWEAPPATLFGVSSSDIRGAPTGGHATTLPQQMIDAEGFISVPFAGRI